MIFRSCLNMHYIAQPLIDAPVGVPDEASHTVDPAHMLLLTKGAGEVTFD